MYHVKLPHSVYHFLRAVDHTRLFYSDFRHPFRFRVHPFSLSSPYRFLSKRVVHEVVSRRNSSRNLTRDIAGSTFHPRRGRCYYPSVDKTTVSMIDPSRRHLASFVREHGFLRKPLVMLVWGKNQGSPNERVKINRVRWYPRFPVHRSLFAACWEIGTISSLIISISIPFTAARVTRDC